LAQYFDLFLLIDNEHHQITEWAADGNARELQRLIGEKPDHKSQDPDVRLRSKAEVGPLERHVRSTPESGH
jgi:hypothetical protein